VAPEVAEVGAAYLRVTMLPALLLVFVAGAVLRGAGDTRTPLVVSLLGNAINAFLAYGLIYGNVGLPRLGAVGSAWAAASGRIVGAAILLLVLIYGRGGLSLRGRRDWWPRPGAVRRVLALGVPAALEQALISAAFTALTAIVASLGTQQLATQRITFNALSVSFLPGFGFALAASTLVGQSLGAGRPARARAAARAAAGWVVVWMGAMGTLYFLLAEPIVRLFIGEPAVIELGTRSLRALAPSQPLWGLLFVWSGALRGAGNTRYPLVVNSLCLWLVVGLSFLAVRAFNADLPVLWAFFIPSGALNALAVWWRFRRGDWQDARVLSDE
jgi:putative MATE family efflux protein